MPQFLSADESVAKELAVAAVKEATQMKLAKAAVVVFDDKQRVLAAEVYNADRASAVRTCAWKVKALEAGLTLEEVATVCDACSPSRLCQVALGKRAVQGAVRIEGIGFAAASCIFDSSCDNRILHAGLRATGYRLVKKWAPHREYVFPAPGWGTYVKEKR